MGRRAQRRDMARWEVATRRWASDVGRGLAPALYHQRQIGVRPYDVGLVLRVGERVWAQVPARCSQDAAEPIGLASSGAAGLTRPRIGSWLVTSQRVAGRLWPDVLRWWEWADVIGARVDLDRGRELVQLDFTGDPAPVAWTGPGVPPMAVAAVYHLYGPAALVEHPGLAALRAEVWRMGTADGDSTIGWRELLSGGRSAGQEWFDTR